MTFDDLFDRVYDRDRYNCAHFVAEAWPVVTGEALPAAFDAFLRPTGQRAPDAAARAAFERLPQPVSPCLALMLQHAPTPHVGIWYEGRILHLTERGVNYQPLDVALMGYRNVRFYKCA